MKVKFIEAYGKRLTFELVEIEPLEFVRDKVYELSVKLARNKRSLNANAYCWVLCSKIAEKMDSSKDEIYEEMIQKYGYMEEDITITVKAEVNMSHIDGHWKYITTSKDGKWKAYTMIRGSSKYNTAEMAHFIDMIVQEAKELKIETLTPAEIERLKIEWTKWQAKGEEPQDEEERKQKEPSQRSSTKTA